MLIQQQRPQPAGRPRYPGVNPGQGGQLVRRRAGRIRKGDEMRQMRDHPAAAAGKMKLGEKLWLLRVSCRLAIVDGRGLRGSCLLSKMVHPPNI